jgi:hypothetical protein
LRVDVKEWLAWAYRSGVRADLQGFIAFMPEALMRPVPSEPVPFSTPRAWAALSQALTLAEKAGVLDAATRRALAFGRVTAEDAALYCAMAEEAIAGLLPIMDYIHQPAKLPTEDSARWFVLCRVRTLLQRGELSNVPNDVIHQFLLGVPTEHRFALMVDLVNEWGALGAQNVFRETLREVTGI